LEAVAFGFRKANEAVGAAHGDFRDDRRHGRSMASQKSLLVGGPLDAKMSPLAGEPSG